MALDPKRLQDVMRYAVAVAGNLDDAKRRELGPIHLLKYAYLADLAQAEAAGETYSGCAWRFHHFGPYEAEAWKQIEPAMAASGICSRVFQGRYQDDVKRYRSTRPELEEELEAKLPARVARRVKRLVAELGNDTPALLHYVYLTPPMLSAAPQEALDFSLAKVAEVRRAAARPALIEPPVSKTAAKKKKMAHDELKARFQKVLQDKLAHKDSSSPVIRQPRYDEVFEKGVAWLDAQAGDPVGSLQGEVLVSDGIWKSKTRNEPGIP